MKHLAIFLFLMTVPGRTFGVEKQVDSNAPAQTAKPSPELKLPPDDAKVLFEYRFDTQEKVDAHWRSSHEAPAPKVMSENRHTFLRWPITDHDEFGRLPSTDIDIPQTGIVDVDVLMRIPQSWIELGNLPRKPNGAGQHTSFKAMKLFRLFPPNGGHNATIFGQMGAKYDIHLRDFDGDKKSPLIRYKFTPQQWTAYRIRYNYDAKTVGLWVARDGKFVEIGTVPGGGEKIARVGPIFHSTSRNEKHGKGKHPPTYVDYHSYRVLFREPLTVAK